jgi:hypothetical protein
MHRTTDDRIRPLAMGAGFGLGAVYIVLSLLALLSAARGLSNDRGDWALGWGLVGVLLLAAGIVAIVGTWWHHNRVVKRHHH